MSLRIKTEDGDIVVADVGGGGGGGGGSDYEVVKVETTAKTITAPEGACYFALAKTEGMSTWVEDAEVYGKELYFGSFSTGRTSYEEKVTFENIVGEFDSVELSYSVIAYTATDELDLRIYFSDGTSTIQYEYNVNNSTPRFRKLNFPKPIKKIEAKTARGYTIYTENISYKPKSTKGYINGALKSIKIGDETIELNTWYPDCDVSGNIIDYDSNIYYHNYTTNLTNREIVPLEEPERIELVGEDFPYEIASGETIELLSTSDYSVPVTLYFKKKVN